MRKSTVLGTVSLVLILFSAVSVLVKIKHLVEFREKNILAQEAHQTMEYLMIDLSKARENALVDLPADGSWHHRIAFRKGQGVTEYVLKGNALWRLNNGRYIFIANDIDHLYIRRRKKTPDILEIEIKTRKGITLVSNLKVRILP